ncbi:hypothetical protein [Synechococcus sp. PCC 6312]|uniref:hypothetical protein n=1 Tax=Synechococcus sp. (strain ATCC 27167 / PCC 6312) TaxID=195253 RepID=UPI00029EEF61|nr:hypothetical protein [Synechococcus sp. PCC 6312]AFY60527.1 hypothetical protein Syn6312_1355 [Synechococcus sp. PCC 6312]
MASAITTTATSLEGQALEVARELVELELAVPEDTRPDNAQIAIDLEGLVATVTIALPITISGSGANLSIAAGEYLD